MSELPESAIGALRMFATTQTQIDVFSDQLIASVKQGEVNPLEVLIQLRAFEKVTKRVLEEIKDELLTASAKYSETRIELYGSIVEKAELGTKFDDSVCKDPVVQALEEYAMVANEKLKARQEFLKALKEPLTILDELTGEVSKIYPPSKKSTSGLKVTIR
jgi:uncharacterized protein YjgD (DUF1641 family)